LKENVTLHFKGRIKMANKNYRFANTEVWQKDKLIL
jgi:hypothetical protein